MVSVKRRDILILLSIWLVGCFLIMALVAVFYSQRPVAVQEPPPPTATFKIDFEGEAAKTAYMRALPDAENWQDDVALVAISTFWPQATVETISSAETWDLRFFSPGHQRIYFAVAENGQPVVGRAHIFKQKNGSPTLIDPTEWLVDSDEALSLWLNNGGGKFLEAFPQSRVEALLRELPEQKGLVWDIIASSQDQSQFFYLSINAENGDVLN